MYCVGLTGSIASGKSTVATHFAALGIDVMSADKIARELVEPNQPALQQIIGHFGPSVLTPEGELNRRYLREHIINHPADRVWLEQCLHPLIRGRIQQAIQTCTSPYCIIEIPLLTDRTLYPYLNRVLLIEGVRESQITRLMKRDNSSREHAIAMLATTQADEQRRQAIADDKVINNGSLDALHEKINALHVRYLQISRSQTN